MTARRSLRGVTGTALAIAVFAAACGSSTATTRDFVRYHDPAGVFVAELPAGHTLTPTEPTPETPSGPGILAGVVAAPAGDAATSSAIGIGSALTADPDRTTFQVIVLTSQGFESLDEMVLAYLTADPLIDVREERALDVGGDPGRLVVADVLQDGTATGGIAAVFSLGHGGSGAILAAVFPPGGWDAERADFLRMVRSFTADVPPGALAVPF